VKPPSVPRFQFPVSSLQLFIVDPWLRL